MTEIETETTETDGFDEVEMASPRRPLPGVSIHIFCLSPESLESVKPLSKNRLMKNTQLFVHEGGLDYAIEHFADTTTPNILLVEFSGETDELWAKLGDLAELCDPETKVVVSTQVNDIALYRELLDKGVTDYLVSPLSSNSVLDTLYHIYTDPAATKIGRNIVFIGSKGGVGASTISHNVAWLLAEEKHFKTVVVDLDFEFGTLGLNFNLDTGQGIAEALNEPDRMDDVLLERLFAPATDRLNLFTAPSVVHHGVRPTIESITKLRNVLTGHSPFIIFDVPHRWNNWIENTVVNADDVVIVATPDIASVRNTKNLIDTLRDKRGSDEDPLIVMNKVGRPGFPDIQPVDFENSINCKIFSQIPFDGAAFGNAENEGAVLSSIGKKSAATKLLSELASAITGNKSAAKPETSSAISALMKKITGK